MPNPPYDPKQTKPGSAGWFEPDGTFHAFNVDLEPDAEYAARVVDRFAGARISAAFAGAAARIVDSARWVRGELSGIRRLLGELSEAEAEELRGLLRGKLDALRAAAAGNADALRALHAMLEGTQRRLEPDRYYRVDTIALDVLHAAAPMAATPRGGRTLTVASMTAGTTGTISLPPAGTEQIPLVAGLTIDELDFADVLVTNAAQAAGSACIVITAGRG